MHDLLDDHNRLFWKGTRTHKVCLQRCFDCGAQFRVTYGTGGGVRTVRKHYVSSSVSSNRRSTSATSSSPEIRLPR